AGDGQNRRLAIEQVPQAIGFGLQADDRAEAGGTDLRQRPRRHLQQARLDGRWPGRGGPGCGRRLGCVLHRLHLWRAAASGRWRVYLGLAVAAYLPLVAISLTASPAARSPERIAPSMVAGRPVAVQSPARNRFDQRVAAGGRFAACSGVCAKVARRSLTMRPGGCGSRGRASAAAVSAHRRAVITSLGSSASASAALTVRLTRSSRTNSHSAVPPISPSSTASPGRRTGPGSRKWPLTMVWLAWGVTRPGNSAAACP